jgi:hypothetical protein
MTEYAIPIGELIARSSYPLGISGLATDELRIAFLQSTAPLCSDVQRLIWHEVLHCSQPIEPPSTPRKCPTYSRLSSVSLPRNLFQVKS